MKRLLRWLARAAGWTMVWVLAAAATFFAYDQVLLERARARSTRAARELDQARTHLLELEASIAHLAELEAAVASTRKQAARLEGMLPAQADVAGYEARLREEVALNGLRLVRLTAGSAEAKQHYRRTRLEIEVVGPLPILLRLPALLPARTLPDIVDSNGYRFVRRAPEPLVQVEAVHFEPEGDAHRLRATAWTYSQAP